MKRIIRVCLAIALIMLILSEKGETQERKAAGGLRFTVSFPAERSKTPLDGRLLLMISTDGSKEPRTQIDNSLKTQQIFGIDVEGFKPGASAVFDNRVFGYPVKSLELVPRGTYWVQALLHKYETFHRADGHTVKLPMDRGEGQHWNLAPGNIYSKPRQITIDAKKPESVSIVLDQEIPPIPPPRTPDTSNTSRFRARNSRNFGEGRSTSALVYYYLTDSRKIRTPIIR